MQTTRPGLGAPNSKPEPLLDISGEIERNPDSSTPSVYKQTIEHLHLDLFSQVE